MIGAFAAIGALVMLIVVGYLLKLVYREIKKIHRVAKHYYAVCDHGAYFESDRDFFRKMQKKIDDFQGRLYVVERKTNNAGYQVISLECRLNEHEKTFKHTKKAVRKRKRK